MLNWIVWNEIVFVYSSELFEIEMSISIKMDLASLPGPLWPGIVAPDGVLSMGQIELYCVLMLNWVDWYRTVLTFNSGQKLESY